MLAPLGAKIYTVDCCVVLLLLLFVALGGGGHGGGGHGGSGCGGSLGITVIFGIVFGNHCLPV